jgi:hypothetical protein
MAARRKRLAIRKMDAISTNWASTPKIRPLSPIPKSIDEKIIPLATPRRCDGVMTNAQDCSVGIKHPNPNPNNAPEMAISKLECANESTHIPTNVADVQNITSPIGPFSSNHLPAMGLPSVAIKALKI